MTPCEVEIKKQIVRGDENKLKVMFQFPQLESVPEHSSKQIVIVGAGLGGLGAAISILLAGHGVVVLESTSTIGDVTSLLSLSNTR
jgi:heterodisulfide reductase subunit A-like polyferredoxin